MSGTRCTCGAGHATFGACLRAKSLQFVDIRQHERTLAWDGELDAYEGARRNGLQPASTKIRDTKMAYALSDIKDEPYRHGETDLLDLAA